MLALAVQLTQCFWTRSFNKADVTETGNDFGRLLCRARIGCVKITPHPDWFWGWWLVKKHIFILSDASFSDCIEYGTWTSTWIQGIFTYYISTPRYHIMHVKNLCLEIPIDKDFLGTVRRLSIFHKLHHTGLHHHEAWCLLGHHHYLVMKRFGNHRR